MADWTINVHMPSGTTTIEVGGDGIESWHAAFVKAVTDALVSERVVVEAWDNHPDVTRTYSWTVDAASPVDAIRAALSEEPETDDDAI